MGVHINTRITYSFQCGSKEFSEILRCLKANNSHKLATILLDQRKRQAEGMLKQCTDALTNFEILLEGGSKDDGKGNK